MAFKNLYLEDLTNLEKMPLPNTFILSGDSSYIQKECIAIIKKLMLLPESQIFNCEELNARILDPDELVNALKSFPINSNYRLILVDEVDKASQKIFDLLKEVIEHPHKEIILILITENALKFRFLSHVAEETYKAYKIADPYESQLYKWIMYIAKKYKKKILGSAIEYLKINICTNLGRLDKEIEKISSTIKDKDVIDLKDIEGFISDSKSVTIFDLTDALSQKDLQNSLRYFNKLKNQKEPPLYIMNVFYRQFYQLVLGHLYTAEGISPSEICTKLKINSYFQKKFLGSLKNFTLQELEKIIDKLTVIDSHIKTSKMDPQILMKNLIRNVCVA